MLGIIRCFSRKPREFTVDRTAPAVSSTEERLIKLLIEVLLICELITANNLSHWLIFQVFPTQGIDKMAYFSLETGTFEETNKDADTVNVDPYL